MRGIVTLMLACGVPTVVADTLQFEVGRGGPFASYARVQISNQHGQHVYSGTSDGFGRVLTKLGAGNYTVRVTTRSGVKTSNVQLRGADVLLRVTLPN